MMTVSTVTLCVCRDWKAGTNVTHVLWHRPQRNVVLTAVIVRVSVQTSNTNCTNRPPRWYGFAIICLPDQLGACCNIGTCVYCDQLARTNK